MYICYCEYYSNVYYDLVQKDWDTISLQYSDTIDSSYGIKLSYVLNICACGLDANGKFTRSITDLYIRDNIDLSPM